MPLGAGGGQGRRGAGRGRSGGGSGRDRSASGAGSRLWSLLQAARGGRQGRGRLRDPKTYLLLAPGTCALQWLEQRYLKPGGVKPSREASTIWKEGFQECRATMEQGPAERDQ